jgi:hypothetical protein
VDFTATVLLECRSHQPVMVGEDAGVPGAQPRQQPRRTLNVGEQKGDGPGRKLHHCAQLRSIVATSQEVLQPTARRIRLEAGALAFCGDAQRARYRRSEEASGPPPTAGLRNVSA